MNSDATQNAMALAFNPILPVWVIVCLLTACAMLLAFSIYRNNKRGILARALCTILFVLALLSPSVVHEKRERLPSTVFIVADQSNSQTYGQRMPRTNNALKELKTQIENQEGLKAEVVNTPVSSTTSDLFMHLEKATENIPANQRSGAIFITDGQVHDIPNAINQNKFGPVYTLLSGEKNEKDRRLSILQAPAYGIVGQDVTITYRIDDINAEKPNKNALQDVTLTVRRNGHADITQTPRIGEERSVTIRIDHAGENIIDLEASPLTGEITQTNNRAPIIINGVRDRLRVLLVSGMPHAGGRTWRNILTSDPGVDLVHFTILRDQNKIDLTSPDEMSLIAFPFEELFEEKLYDFDLIIFDRYQLNNIMPPAYFENIAAYVAQGGGFLAVNGSEFAGPQSIYNTALAGILPAAPTGTIFPKEFKPQTSVTGQRHPVTDGLGKTDQAWGPWLRQIETTTSSGGDVLMQGYKNAPLLILKHTGQGRVAQLTSDQIWLWSRGYKGGGPYAQLIRNTAHWLMKEPALDETRLDVRVDGDTLHLSRKSLQDDFVTVTVTPPDGEPETIRLQRKENTGDLVATYNASRQGIYTISDGTITQFAIKGQMNTPEQKDIITTAEKMQPINDATGGSIVWLSETPNPAIALLSKRQRYGDKDRIGLRNNQAYNVTGIEQKPLFPRWIYLLVLGLSVIFMWWNEGRGAKT